MTAPLLQYKFPLRKDVMAYLNLPAELTDKDVSRLFEFLFSLSMDRMDAKDRWDLGDEIEKIEEEINAL